MAPPTATPEKERGPEKRQGLAGGLTGNALVSGVVSAIVAGVISFTVAHYQDQDAARQAVAGQQASAVVQLETAANTLYQATMVWWGTCIINLNECPNGPATNATYLADQATFNADRLNVSDARADALAAQLTNSADNAFDTVGVVFPPDTYISEVVETYQHLITRCGQLIQGP